MKAIELLAGVNPTSVSGNLDHEIRSIAFDSRLIESGDMFVALRGGYVDGHDYLRSARERGAIAAVVEAGVQRPNVSFPLLIEVSSTRATLATLATNLYRNPSRDLSVIGVTGTDGKTTTSHFIEAMCRSAGRSTGLIGTVEVRIGADGYLHESRQTTPESLLVQQYLAEMCDARVDTAIVEATSHGLELHRLDGVEFDIGVVTNVTREHLDFHGTIENYRRAKGGLLRRVRDASFRGKRGVVAINADDEGARSLEPFADGCRIIRYSVRGDSSAHVRATDIVADAQGSSFLLSTESDNVPVSIRLPGSFNVANALAAATTGVALDIEPDAIARGLNALTSVPGRMESIDEGQPFAVVVDYAHSPEAIRSVLREVRGLATNRVLIVFGSAGERDVGKRAEQGFIAVTDADLAVFTSEDPRFEDPVAIIADIASGAVEAGGRPGVDFECIEDRRQAIARALEVATHGDVVVLAGKGHERSMIYEAEKRPWHEPNVARDVLRSLGYARTHGIDTEVR